MKNITGQELDALADLYESTARILRAKGREAVRRARDWATPLHSANGFGPKNEVSRPTENAALNPDPLADEWTLYSVDCHQSFDAVASVRDRTLRITTDAVVENQRAGIGYCDECGKYCDGSTDSKRLRVGICDACRSRQRRKEAKGDVCPHHSTTWSQGRKWCNVCHAELDGATG